MEFGRMVVMVIMDQFEKRQYFFPFSVTYSVPHH